MLAHLSLAGDGDEVEAIEDVEREFGIALDISDAPNWVTVGDVNASLQRALPDYLRNQPSTWPRFCRALCKVVGDDPSQLAKTTRLLIP